MRITSQCVVVVVFYCVIVIMHVAHVEFVSRSWRGVQHYVIIKFVSDLPQIGGFLLVLWFPPPIKLAIYTDRHDITEILLNTIHLFLSLS
jgi:hypothetical protein